MKTLERDELLIRMDERLKALKDGDEGDIPEIKNHLAVQNNKITKNSNKINYIIGVLSGLAILGGSVWGIIYAINLGG